ncbi:hypothetical protein IKF28_01075 [Candidatus Saccharibacteria bacterium]|nr:hypothetical protein [Candidatus Saccharibacteria bacterium]
MKEFKRKIGKTRLALLRYQCGDYENKILKELNSLMADYEKGKKSEAELHAVKIKYLFREFIAVCDETVTMDYYKVKKSMKKISY